MEKYIGIILYHDGEMCRVLDTKTLLDYWCHHSALENFNYRDPLFFKYKKGQKVEFTLYENLYSVQIDSIKKVG